MTEAIPLNDPAVELLRLMLDNTWKIKLKAAEVLLNINIDIKIGNGLAFIYHQKGCWAVDNYDKNKTQIYFPSYIFKYLCEFLKSDGFRWDPKNGVWYRNISCLSHDSAIRYINFYLEDQHDLMVEKEKVDCKLNFMRLIALMKEQGLTLSDLIKKQI